MITTQVIEYATTDNTPVDIPINISASAARISGIVYATNDADVNSSYQITAIVSTNEGSLTLDYSSVTGEYEFTETMDCTVAIDGSFKIRITGIDVNTIYWIISITILTV